MPAPTKSDKIDRVDDDDRVVGTVPRGEALARRAGFRVVHVLVVNSNGELLLQQVGHKRERSPGRWGSSVAGYLHAGETPADGAKRRLREEIGVESPLRFCGRSMMEDEGSHKFVYVYLAHADHPEILEPQHIAGLKFWSWASVREQMRKDPNGFTETFPLVVRTAAPSVGA